LFFGNRTQTSTSEIKSHYKRSGFDPAGKIRPGILKLLKTHRDFQDRSTPPSRTTTSMLIAAGAFLLVWNAVAGGTDAGTLLGIAIWAGLSWGVGAIGAWRYQKRADGLFGWRLRFLVLPAWYLYSAARGISS